MSDLDCYTAVMIDSKMSKFFLKIASNGITLFLSEKDLNFMDIWVNVTNKCIQFDTLMSNILIPACNFYSQRKWFHFLSGILSICEHSTTLRESFSAAKFDYDKRNSNWSRMHWPQGSSSWNFELPLATVCTNRDCQKSSCTSSNVPAIAWTPFGSNFFRVETRSTNTRMKTCQPSSGSGPVFFHPATTTMMVVTSANLSSRCTLINEEIVHGCFFFGQSLSSIGEWKPLRRRRRQMTAFVVKPFHIDFSTVASTHSL